MALVEIGMWRHPCNACSGHAKCPACGQPAVYVSDRNRQWPTYLFMCNACVPVVGADPYFEAHCKCRTVIDFICGAADMVFEGIEMLEWLDMAERLEAGE